MPPNRIRIQPSGAQKKKQRQQRDALVQSQSGSLNRYFKRNTEQVQTGTNVNVHENENEQENNENQNVDDSGNMDEPNLIENEEERIIAEDDQQNAGDNGSMEDVGENIDMQEEDDQHGSRAAFDFPFDIDDPGNWEKMKQNSRDFLVERGPKREINFTFPDDHKGRRFSSNNYCCMLSIL